MLSYQPPCTLDHRHLNISRPLVRNSAFFYKVGGMQLFQHLFSYTLSLPPFSLPLMRHAAGGFEEYGIGLQKVQFDELK